MADTFEEMYTQNKGKAWSQFKDAAADSQNISDQKEKQQTEDAEAKRLFQERVEKETLKIYDERSAPHPHPKWEIADLYSEGSIHEEAIRRVKEQIAHEQAQKEQSRNVTNNVPQDERPSEKERIAAMPDEEKQKHFKAEIHKAVETAKTAREQARKIFYNDRERLIEEARNNGSQEPEKDVSIAQRKINRDIDQQEHRDIHAVFEKHGWDYDKQSVSFSEEDRNEPQPNHDQTPNSPTQENDRGHDHEQ